MVANTGHSSGLIDITRVDISRYLETRAKIRMVDTRNDSDGLFNNLVCG